MPGKPTTRKLTRFFLTTASLAALAFASASYDGLAASNQRSKRAIQQKVPGKLRCLAEVERVIVRITEEKNNLAVSRTEVAGDGTYGFVNRSVEAPPSSRRPVVDVSQFTQGAVRIHALADKFRELAESKEWTPAPGSYNRFTGLKLEHPKTLEGHEIAGFRKDDGGTVFSGRVVHVFQDAERPTVSNAVLIGANGERKVVPLTGAGALLIKNHTPEFHLAEDRRFLEGSFTQVAPESGDRHVGEADKLAQHSTAKGVVHVTRTKDGTFLVPKGTLRIDGEIVSARASAFLPAAPGQAEREGLRALEAEGYKIIGFLAEGGQRYVYTVEKGGKKFAAKIIDPERLFPYEAHDYPSAVEHGGDWRHNPKLTPSLEAKWRAVAEETAAKLLNREQTMAEDLGKRGFDPVMPVDNPRLALKGVGVFELFGDMTLGEALANHPELINDPEVLKRQEGLAKYDAVYNIQVNQGYYGIPLAYMARVNGPLAPGQLEYTVAPLGIDMKPHGYHVSWDNTRVILELVNGKVRIKKARDVDW